MFDAVLAVAAINDGPRRRVHDQRDVPLLAAVVRIDADAASDGRGDPREQLLRPDRVVVDRIGRQPPLPILLRATVATD